MIKINRSTLIENIKHISNIELSENGVPPLDDSYILEKVISNNYYYSTAHHSTIWETHNHLQNLLKTVPINNCATAFTSNKSYLNFLEPHKNNYNFLRLDIKSFFHSISKNLLLDSLTPYFEDSYVDKGETQKLIEAFINMVTYTIPASSNNEKHKGKTVIPIGFKTSPLISNIVFRKIDILIQAHCKIHKTTYTRYADDMLFSSTIKNNNLNKEIFTKIIKEIIESNNFKLNLNKTIYSKHTISLNGYFIKNEVYENNHIGISNKKTDTIKKIIYKINNGDTPESILLKIFNHKFSLKSSFSTNFSQQFKNQYYQDQLINKLTGYRSYLISFIKFNQNYNCISNENIKKYSNIIDEINKILLKI
jgi:RNA-directed DNA polymerase